MVELGLLAIKVLKLLGRFLTTTFRLIAGFFAFIFNFFFKRILVKIYFEIFRLKKNYSPDKKSNNFLNLLKKNLAFFSIITLTLVSIFANISNKNQVSAAGSQASKTIMADLIKNQFSLYQEGEELITDSYVPSIVEGGDKHDKDYLDAIIEKDLGLIKETENINLNTLANEDALAIKPEGISTDSAKTNSSNTATSKRDKIVSYAVSPGDTVSSIAKQFGITINTVLWANNLGAYSLIRPGDELSILPESGVIHNVKSGDTISKIAKTYDIDEEDILASNELGAVLKIGDKIMVPGGTKLKAAVVPKPKTTGNTGISIIRDFVKAPDAPSGDDTSGQKMLWPTEGHRITQYFSWSHTGLDIANKTGTPLYAAEAGKVEYSGWSNGYGYNVLIDHGGGKKTRYAHASKLFVKAGDSVLRGENIAAMGSTGWSTGPHIHFEVIINGKKYNPLNYIN